MSRTIALLFGLASAVFARADDAVWQWSVPMGAGRAFLWIPENCEHVRAVIVGQHNMIEQSVLEHATMRRTLAALGIAEVLVAPPFDRVFQFDRGAGEQFDRMMHGLADESGYDELASAPVIPIGHSACASYPWNFAAWSPGRTLAILSVKGDAPQTDLTGSGAPNPEWGTRNIDGVPALMVMSEYEWWDARVEPAVKFRAAHPRAPVALLADVRHGHFDASDELVELLAMFIRKAAEARLDPMDHRRNDVASEKSHQGTPELARSCDQAVRDTKSDSALVPVDPARGWLIDRWRDDAVPRAPASPVADYHGDRANAFWCFDAEMARAFEAYYASNRRTGSQQVDFVHDGGLAAISTSHTGVELVFQPDEDGVTFSLEGDFIVPLPPRLPVAAKDKPPPPRTVVPTRAANGTHASGAVRISPVTGPVVRVGLNTFRVAFGRILSTSDERNYDIWFLASNPGDASYKAAVQQARMRIGPCRVGADQHLDFPAIPDQTPGSGPVTLAATSDAGIPVGYYVREGPAEIEAGKLRLTVIPPRARFPLKVTVVAWQLGRSAKPQVKTAATVERTFSILRP